MNKWQFENFLKDYCVLFSSLKMWLDKRTDKEQRAIKNKWYSKLKKFQEGYLLRAADDIFNSGAKPQFPDDHLMALHEACKRITPIKRHPLLDQPLQSKDEKMTSKQALARCQAILQNIKDEDVYQDTPCEATEGPPSVQTDPTPSPVRPSDESGPREATVDDKRKALSVLSQELLRLDGREDIPF